MMIDRYREPIYRLTRLLRQLESNKEDYKLLARIQRKLAACIVQIERNIAIRRGQISTINRLRRSERFSRELSSSLKEAIGQIREDISHLKQISYFIRCFGDGIAFIYLDKFALKHMFYKVENYEMKESPGHIHNKKGFKAEWRLLLSALNHRVPAVLCDLTNTLRHGDVCLLGASDPYPLEVKSSANRNERVDRQRENIAALISFYKNDEAKNFRGIKKTIRVEMPEAAHHRAAMNECIRKSCDLGSAMVEPENGLTYIAIRDEDDSFIQNAFNPASTILCLLNEAKSDGDWAPYYPFSLMIRNEEDLYEFLKGSLALIVCVDVEKYAATFKENGLDAEFVAHPQILVKVTPSGSDQATSPTALIPIQTFGRHLYELETIGTAVARELRHIKHLHEDASWMEAALTNGKLSLNDLDLLTLPIELPPLKAPSSG